MPLLRAFSLFASHVRSRAAKSAMYENLWAFIRFDAHVAKAGIELSGWRPLTTPPFLQTMGIPCEYPFVLLANRAASLDAADATQYNIDDKK